MQKKKQISYEMFHSMRLKGPIAKWGTVNAQRDTAYIEGEGGHHPHTLHSHIRCLPRALKLHSAVLKRGFIKTGAAVNGNQLASIFYFSTEQAEERS